jgi:putative membrane protein insertion efficiency factor
MVALWCELRVACRLGCYQEIILHIHMLAREIFYIFMTEDFTVDYRGRSIKFRTEPHLAPNILRAMFGSTPIDDEVDKLDVPRHPFLLNLTIRALRAYRKYLSRKLGSRCVFEPSCSRYAELALCRFGLFRGSIISFRRHVRCRPGMGGIDLPYLLEKEQKRAL